MYELLLKNESGNVFSKYFDSPYLMNKFKNKIRYSKKLTLLGEFKH